MAGYVFKVPIIEVPENSFNHSYHIEINFASKTIQCELLSYFPAALPHQLFKIASTQAGNVQNFIFLSKSMRMEFGGKNASKQTK